MRKAATTTRRQGQSADPKSLAKELLVQLWRLAEELAGEPIPPHGILPVDPRFIAEKLLGLRVERREELREDVTDPRRKVVAGKFEGADKRIVFSARQSERALRFTLAHELGHYLLEHPQLVCLRERSLQFGGDSANSGPLESAADKFAAELLMPDKLVRAFYFERFGRIMGPADVDEDVAHYLSVGQRLVPSQIRAMRPVDRAALFARAHSFRGASFRSITEAFGVSCEAMAYRLIELGLVE